MISIVGYDILGNGSEGLRYAWRGDRFLPYVESAAFSNRSKGKCENISGYTTSVSSGCILKAQKKQCLFCRTGCMLPFNGLLTYKEIAKQNIFMVLTDIYCTDHPELATKQREFAYMGQGEPGYSYSQVRLAIELTNSIMRELNQTVYRHVFATCGIPEAIENYTKDIQHFFTEKVTLHFSLHATQDRNLIMPINEIYPYKESLNSLNQIYEISGEKPCVGIMLFKDFIPRGKEFRYSNSIENVLTIIRELNPDRCRLSFCEFNPSEELGSASDYPQELAENLLNMVREMGFEAKLFSSYGREKQTACGMLGGKEPERKVSSKWRELENYADELIEKYT